MFVYRCSLCLWFAIAGYVVTMWMDVPNPRGSRASTLLWRAYIAAVVFYVLLVPIVTLVAYVTPGESSSQSWPLLAVPDFVRMVGEVFILFGFAFSAMKLWRGYRQVTVFGGLFAVSHGHRV